jgi:beta-fructofuranosidase
LEEHKAGEISIDDPHRTELPLIMPSHLSVFAAIGGLLTFGHAQDSSNTSTASFGVTSVVTETVSATSTSTYSQSDVPTGISLPGDYDEPLRPQVHFSPPVGFMSKSSII